MPRMSYAFFKWLTGRSPSLRRSTERRREMAMITSFCTFFVSLSRVYKWSWFFSFLPVCWSPSPECGVITNHLFFSFSPFLHQRFTTSSLLSRSYPFVRRLTWNAVTTPYSITSNNRRVRNRHFHPEELITIPFFTSKPCCQPL